MTKKTKKTSLIPSFPGNYQPIWELLFLSMVMEKSNQMFSLLKKLQSGFWSDPLENGHIGEKQRNDQVKEAERSFYLRLV